MSVASKEVLAPPKGHPLTTWDGKQILETLMAELPTPVSEYQQLALAALQSGKYNLCKVYPCLALDDDFVKAIGYMSSIPGTAAKGMPQLATLIGESCRAIAEAFQQRSLETDTHYMDEGVNKAEAVRSQKLQALETINQQIFAKALGEA